MNFEHPTSAEHQVLLECTAEVQPILCKVIYFRLYKCRKSLIFV